MAKVESRLAYTYGCTLRHKVFDLNGTVRRIPDFAVFAAVNRGNAKFQIRVRRLRFLVRLLNNGAPSIITLLDATLVTAGSFASLVVEDLAWLRQYAGLTDSQPDPAIDIRPWLRLAMSSQWHVLLKRASRDAVFEHVENCKLMCLHRHIACSFRLVKCQCIPPVCVRPPTAADPAPPQPHLHML